MDKNRLIASQEVLYKYFEIEETNSPDELHKQLSLAIQYLLNYRFERLLQVMYQIDVSEEKFNSVFSQKGNIADQLATLVIERVLQKVEFRFKYRNQY
ncbi:MAG: hypothetical protein GY827_02270 [Cytophagales bacterium]|nr:hypothetical protein [Cytophagales bacterium]